MLGLHAPVGTGINLSFVKGNMETNICVACRRQLVTSDTSLSPTNTAKTCSRLLLCYRVITLSKLLTLVVFAPTQAFIPLG